MKFLVSTTALLAGLLVALATACGGASDAIKAPGPPVGKPQLPDIAPAPPLDAQLSRRSGRWLIRFSTLLVNVGDGDFVLRATRTAKGWKVDQDVQYSEAGAKVVRTPAAVVWGGDGHNHWHVRRVAIERSLRWAPTGKVCVRCHGMARREGRLLLLRRHPTVG